MSCDRLLLACTLSIATPCVLANSYSLVELGQPATRAINNSGEIAGVKTLPDHFRAVIYRNGAWQRLKGAGHFCRDGSAAFGMNNAGDVVGWYCTGSSVVWMHNGHARYPAIPAGAYEIGSYPTSIADDGTVVGPYTRVADWSQGCYRTTRDDVSIDLGWDGPRCYVGGINKQGVIVGTGLGKDGQDVAYLWSNGVFTRLGGLAGQPAVSGGHSINNSGIAVGAAQFGQDTHAFLWDGSTMHDIGAGSHDYPDSEASIINNRGVIIGYGWKRSDRITPVRFEDGKIVTLAKEVMNLGSWHLDEVNGINDSGVIVGMASKSGISRAVMLVPQTRP